ncbi:MAG: nucleotidyltransferase protein [Xanthobacteraceae bacterium]|jgi:predicted nucleotidyltransferase|nr:nucleotidyltransferase protein [Xanthobacteraceae bacterium]
MSTDRTNEIQNRLSRLAADEGATILMAVESGSRAWGFASPESDFDVRFIYMRPTNWYLTVRPGRDVIELPLEGDLDIGGWDLRKALGLMTGGNAVIIEWLTSPISYIEMPRFREALHRLATYYLNRQAMFSHYYGLAFKHRKQFLAEPDGVIGKKYFYVIRPALALRWLTQNTSGLPPMNMDAMLGVAPEPVRAAVEKLRTWKQTATEKEKVAHFPVLDEFIDAELERALETMKHMESFAPPDMAPADAFLEEWIRKA